LIEEEGKGGGGEQSIALKEVFFASLGAFKRLSVQPWRGGGAKCKSFAELSVTEKAS